MPLRVVHEVLQKRAAEPLHDRAHDLPVQRQRIDDAPGILHRDIIEKLHVPGLGIDRNVGRMRAVAVGALIAGIGAFRRAPREGGKRQRLLAGTEHGARIDFDILHRAAPALRCGSANVIAQLCRCAEDRVAAHHHRARAIRAAAVAHVIGRAVEHAADVVHRHFQRIRRDLRADRL